MIQQSAGFIDAELVVVDRGFRRHPQAFKQGSRFMLHRLQHVGIGVAADHMVDSVAPARAEADVHGIGGAEEVVQVSHHLLIGTAEEETDQIGLVVAQLMQFEQWFGLSLADEAVEPSVGIAGEVGEIGQPGGLLVELLNRQDREQLINGPGVRRRAEDRQVGVIGAG